MKQLRAVADLPVYWQVLAESAIHNYEYDVHERMAKSLTGERYPPYPLLNLILVT